MTARSCWAIPVGLSSELIVSFHIWLSLFFVLNSVSGLTSGLLPAGGNNVVMSRIPQTHWSITTCNWHRHHPRLVELTRRTQNQQLINKFLTWREIGMWIIFYGKTRKKNDFMVVNNLNIYQPIIVEIHKQNILVIYNKHTVNLS